MSKLAVPPDNEEFVLNVSYEEAMWIEKSNPGWKYLGPKFKSGQTYNYKNARLVRLGSNSLREAIQKADELGFRLLGSHAVNSFRHTYFPDANGSVVFGGPEWQSPDGEAVVSYCHGENSFWNLNVSYSGGFRGFGYNCRWAVVSKSC